MTVLRLSVRVKRNFWLHAMCECLEWYSTYQIRWENWWLGLTVSCSGKSRAGFTCRLIPRASTSKGAPGNWFA